jgi:hypothetical protein
MLIQPYHYRNHSCFSYTLHYRYSLTTYTPCGITVHHRISTDARIIIITACRMPALIVIVLVQPASPMADQAVPAPLTTDQIYVRNCQHTVHKVGALDVTAKPSCRKPITELAIAGGPFRWCVHERFISHHARSAVMPSANSMSNRKINP